MPKYYSYLKKVTIRIVNLTPNAYNRYKYMDTHVKTILKQLLQKHRLLALRSVAINYCEFGSIISIQSIS